MELVSTGLILNGQLKCPECNVVVVTFVGYWVVNAVNPLEDARKAAWEHQEKCEVGKPKPKGPEFL